MHTTTSVLTAHGYRLDAQEYPELEIPILSASQRQGDVLLLKIDDHDMTGARPIGARVEVCAPSRAPTRTPSTAKVTGCPTRRRLTRTCWCRAGCASLLAVRRG